MQELLERRDDLDLSKLFGFRCSDPHRRLKDSCGVREG